MWCGISWFGGVTPWIRRRVRGAGRWRTGLLRTQRLQCVNKSVEWGDGGRAYSGCTTRCLLCGGFLVVVLSWIGWYTLIDVLVCLSTALCRGLPSTCVFSAVGGGTRCREKGLMGCVLLKRASLSHHSRVDGGARVW